MNGLRCILNIGNTHTRTRTVSGSAVLSDVQTDTAAFSPADIPADVPCAACCVVPAVEKAIRAARPDVFFITKDAPGLPGLSEIDASTIGADRLANAAALLDGTLPAMTVDCGSAVNIEIVSAGRELIGGAILPGRQMLRRALHAFTGQLPEIPLEPELPADFPGRNTCDALRYGIDFLILAGVRDLIARTESEVFPGNPRGAGRLRVVFCGGDRDFFLRHLRGEMTSSDLADGGGDFTLRGVLKLWDGKE